ncbi:antirestriction protein ArdA [Pseudoclavibacter sp. CFCC 13796]|uniref:antirestriction protein ArdA n=1 Tax=Pseudoclavibacter sp. CFCC 13796 TaxID=2615179 RepID=UPI0013014249|nr:antirestriction protein ArdA [Pseudoclavibacter sp. CFCC 13796]KAB1661658.1 antirestriction protein ArdA [Pseudoclavibacter sp. CFCC 13796]
MIITPSATDTTPRAWTDCLAYYNRGTPTSDWFDAEIADEVVPATVHGIHIRTDGHDEL